MSESLINKGITIFGEAKRKNSPIVVVGTARGGTSMIAGALAKLGVFMGDRAAPPVYEDVRLSEAFEKKDDESIKSITSEYSINHERWGWKRPSSINYLEYVEKQIDSPSYIFVFKDILSIAQRNSISMLSDILPSMEGALKQYGSCLNFLKNGNHHAMLVSYDKAVTSPAILIDSLIEFCQITPSREQISDAISFIQPNPSEYLDQTRITKASGMITSVYGTRVTGWARFIHTQKPAGLDFFVNDELVGQAIANLAPEYPQDQPSENIWFEFHIPQQYKNQTITLRARAQGDVNDISGSGQQHLISTSLSIHDNFEYLKKSGSPFSNSMLAAGWAPLKALQFPNLLTILILRHENGSEAAWYFDRYGDFFGNKVDSLKLRTSHKNQIISTLFKKIFSEVSNPETSDQILDLIREKKFIYSEILTLINTTQAKEDSNMATKRASEIFQQLNLKGRDIQDAYISASENEPIVKLEIEGQEYTSSHGLLPNNFCVVYPCIGSNKEDLLILFESGHHNSRFSLLDCVDGVMYVTPQKGPKVSLISVIKLLIEHIADNVELLQNYFNLPVQGKSGVLRNIHLGHNLWNDITALYRLEKKNLLDNLEEIILVGGELVEPWMKLDEFSPTARLNRTIRSQNDIVIYFYQGHRFPVRLGDDYIAEEIATRIIKNSKAICSQNTDNLTNELRVVLGLRLENRTWINQTDGLISIAQYLGQKFERISLIIDGHDLISSTNKVHISHHEPGNSSIISLEKEIADKLSDELAGSNVEIIDAVAMSLECSVKWINSADFFIAPWGAGLAKYKWICNLPGIIMTSRWNLANKPDLKIYESPNIREGATPCIYVAPEYIEDRDCSTNNVIVKDMPEHPSRADFIVDIEGIKLAIDELLTQIGKAP